MTEHKWTSDDLRAAMERALCEYQVAMALYARQLWVEASKAQETAESILRETQRRAADGGL